jgi:streptogramin lyase
MTRCPWPPPARRLRQAWLVARSLVALSLLPLVSCSAEPPGGETDKAIKTPALPFLSEIELPGFNRWLNGITAGPAGDNHVWFTEQASAQVGRFRVGESVPSEFPIPESNNPNIAVGSDNNLWITKSTSQQSDGTHVITCVKMSGDPCGKYVIPYDQPVDADTDVVKAGGRWLWGITAADNGYLYFTERYASRIGCFDPRVKVFDQRTGKDNFKSCGEWRTTTGHSDPREITQGRNGNLYFTEYAANRIGCLTPTGADCFETLIPTAESGPFGITVAPDGEGTDLWFTEAERDKIGRFSVTERKVIAEVQLPEGSYPVGITKGPPGDHSVWFTERDGNKIGRLRTDLYRYPPEEFPIPTPNSEPAAITVGPDHRIWFTEAYRIDHATGRFGTSKIGFTSFANP